MSEFALHRPTGKVVTAEEFRKIEGSGWHRRVRDGTAVWAECLACGRDMGPRVTAGRLVGHFCHRPGVDASDCPFSPNPDPRFRHVWADRWDVPRGERLRREFCEERNLKTAFNVCNKVAGSVSTDEFIAMVREADRRRIWRYEAISLAFVPYVLLTLIDLHASANGTRARHFRFGLDFRFVIQIRHTEPLNRLWESPGRYELRPAFTDTGNDIRKIRAFRITDPEIDRARDDIDRISGPAYRKLDRELCRGR